MADNTFTGMGLPPLAPPSPYGEVPGAAIAGQGVNGAPVPFPALPGSPPAYPPSGNQNLDYAPQVPVDGGGGGAGPRRPDERPSEYLARKRAAGEPVTPEDMLALDAEQQALLSAYGGGGVSSTTTSSEHQNDSPMLRELREVRSRAVQGYGDRMSQSANDAARYGEAQSQMYATRGQALEQETAAAQKRQEVQTAELMRRQTEVDKASKDYVKAAQSIDPNRIMSGGRGVLAALAMAAGAYGATLGKTQNFAQQIIDHALDRDLSAQQMALSGKKDALTQSQQAFQNYRSIYQDDAAARAAVRADAREMFATQLESIGSKMKGTEQQTNILNLRDQLLLDNNRLRQEQAERAAGRVQQSTTTQSGVAGAGTGDVLERYTKAAAAAKGINEQVGGGPDTQDKVLYNDVAKQAGDYASMIKVSNQVQGLLDKTDGMLGGTVERGTGLTKDSKLLATARDQLKLAIINASSGKAFTEAERTQINDMLEKGAWTNESLKQKLEQVQTYMAGKIQSHIGTLHPKMQSQLIQRMQAGGVPGNVLQSMFSGQAAQSGRQWGTEEGARSY